MNSALKLAKIEITLEHPFYDSNELIYQPNEEIKEYFQKRKERGED